MSFLSQAPPLGGLLPPHGAFQEHAAHTLEWSRVLSSKGSLGTCIPRGLLTFLHAAFTAHCRVALACPRRALGCQATASGPPWARQRGAPCRTHPPPRGQSGVPQAWPAARRPHAGAVAPASTPAEERGPPPPRKVKGLFPARPSQHSRAAEPVKATPSGWLEDSPALTEPAALPQ